MFGSLRLALGRTPPCPNCKTSKQVVRKGTSPRYSNVTVIMGFRYECKQCSELVNNRNKSEQASDTTTTKRLMVFMKVKIVTIMMNPPRSKSASLTGSFKAWNEFSLRQNPFKDHFPAMLTAKAGVDNDLVDMMVSAFDSGLKSEQFANMLKELHTSHKTKLEILR